MAKTPYQAFPATQWSLIVRAARDPGSADMAEWLRRYMPALRSHLVYRKRFRPEDADDLLQSFLTSKVIERNLIERAEQDRGKFRTFLLTALDRFVLNHLREQKAAKRAPKEMLASEDHAASAAAPDAGPDPFNVEWARELLRRTIGQMEQECRGAGRDDVWEMFNARVLGPTLRQEPAPSYQELVDRFHLQSPAQGSNLLVTGKRMFVRNLRNAISEYEPGEEAIDSEIRDLLAVLGRVD